MAYGIWVEAYSALIGAVVIIVTSPSHQAGLLNFLFIVYLREGEYGRVGAERGTYGM